MRETLELLLSMPSDVREKMSRMESSCIAQVLNAENGDLAAFLAIRDTIGEKPVDRQNTLLQAEILTQEQIDAMVDAEKLGD